MKLNGEDMYDQSVPRVAFSGEWRFLSNMYPAPIRLGDFASTIEESLKPYWMYRFPEDTVFPSSEHLYQACKSDDIGFAETILRKERPESTKTTARKLLQGHPEMLREGFHEGSFKVSLMAAIVKAKFEQNPGLAQKLKDTGSMELVEHNTWKDTFWGVHDGQGKNYLGKILEKVREQIKREN